MPDSSPSGFVLPKRTPIASWSNVAKTETRRMAFSEDLHADRRWMAEGFIPRGAGHSWGDAAMLSRGVTLTSDRLRAVRPVDAAASTVTAEAGVTLGALHAVLEAAGFRFPVYGGTQGVTVGGAAAADIHGKNHHEVGTFGRHVVSLDLVTASGRRASCSRDVDPDLFAATIGGMGLTGFITRLTLRVSPGRMPALSVAMRSVGSIADLLDGLDEDPARDGIGDWLRPGRPGSRGLLTTARTVDTEDAGGPPRRPLALPLPRIAAFNRATVAALDALLHRAVPRRPFTLHARRFHHGGPHEWLADWNKLFGARGVIEFHCAVPRSGFGDVWDEVCRAGRDGIARPRFAVIKRLGATPSPGLLSFPLDGYSLNFHVDDTAPARAWLVELGWRVARLGGRPYLAKDAVAIPEQIEATYPRLTEWRRIVRIHDPAGLVRSDLSLRLGLKPW